MFQDAELGVKKTGGGTAVEFNFLHRRKELFINEI